MKGQNEGRSLTLRDRRTLRVKQRTLVDARRTRTAGKRKRKSAASGGPGIRKQLTEEVKEMSDQAVQQLAEEPSEVNSGRGAAYRAGRWAAGKEVGVAFGGGKLAVRALSGTGRSIRKRQREKTTGKMTLKQIRKQRCWLEKTRHAAAKTESEAKKAISVARRAAIRTQEMSKWAARTTVTVGKGMLAVAMQLAQLILKLLTLLGGMLLSFLAYGGLAALLVFVVLGVLIAGLSDSSSDYASGSRCCYYVSEGVELEDYIQSINDRWAEGLFADPAEVAVLVFYGTGNGELTIDWDACLICFAVYCDGNYKEGDTLTDEDVAALDAMILYFSAVEQEMETIDFSVVDMSAWETADGIWSMTTKAKLPAAPEGAQQTRVITLLEPDIEKLYQVFEFDDDMREDCEGALEELKEKRAIS